MSATPKVAVQPAHLDIIEFSHARKWLIAVSVMLGTILEVLDSTVVNVSLPHMQGSFSASVDEIAGEESNCLRTPYQSTSTL